MIKKTIMKKISFACAIFFMLAFVIYVSPVKVAKATARYNGSSYNRCWTS